MAESQKNPDKQHQKQWIEVEFGRFSSACGVVLHAQVECSEVRGRNVLVNPEKGVVCGHSTNVSGS